MTPHAQRLLQLWPYRSRLVALMLNRGSGRPDAEDIASQTIERVALATTFREDTADPWRYLAVTAVRLRRAQQRLAAHHEKLRRDVRLIPRPRALEDDVAARDLARRAVAELRDREPVETVAMVVRKAIDGLTWDELAAEFSVTRSSAQSRVQRALARFRRSLAGGRSSPAAGRYAQVTG